MSILSFTSSSIGLKPLVVSAVFCHQSHPLFTFLFRFLCQNLTDQTLGGWLMPGGVSPRPDVVASASAVGPLAAALRGGVGPARTCAGPGRGDCHIHTSEILRMLQSSWQWRRKTSRNTRTRRQRMFLFFFDFGRVTVKELVEVIGAKKRSCSLKFRSSVMKVFT